MRRPVAPPPHEWKTIAAHGRSCFEFPIRMRGDRQQRFTVARHIADRYRVEGVLTRGGGGIILEATDERTGNPVLIKALAEYDLQRHELLQPLDEVLESLRQARHHLQTERRILVQLGNAGCSAVPEPLDYVFDANPALEGPYRTTLGQWWRLDEAALLTSEPYLVMQRLPGKSLQERLETQFPNGMPPRRALRIVDEVAAVLERLHRPWPMPHGQLWQIVYKDLKPSNILIDAAGRATLLDFGGCQLRINGTLVLDGLYTAGYAAPECSPPGHAVTAAADCYGLGATLFHLLTGTSPRRLPPREIPGEASPFVVLDLGALPRHCPPELVALLRRMLDRDPRRRFATAGEFRAALAPLLDRPPVAGALPSLPSIGNGSPHAPPAGALESGSRLSSGEGQSYEIGAWMKRTFCGDEYRGRKHFRNFRHDERQFYQASAAEALEVQIRMGGATSTDARARQFARQRMHHELSRVLPALGEWAVQPLDWFEHDGCPLLVTSPPRGHSLRLQLSEIAARPDIAVRLSVTMLRLLDRLHAAGLFCGALGLDDFLRDDSEKLLFTATDRVVAVDEAVLVRRLLPAEFRRHNCLAPEAARPVGPIDGRADLFSWGAMTLALLNGRDVTQPDLDDPLVFANADVRLRDAAARDLKGLAQLAPSREFDETSAVVSHWTETLRRCLAVDPEARPSSAAAIFQGESIEHPARRPLRRLLSSPFRAESR